jgi:hypothetical protein
MLLNFFPHPFTGEVPSAARRRGATVDSKIVLIVLKPRDVVDETAQQSHEALEIFIAPFGEDGRGKPLARGRQRIRHTAPRLCDDSFMHARVHSTRPPFDKTELHELRDLTADGRVVAAGPFGKRHNANRTETLDADQKRKERAIERKARLFQQNIVLLRPVHQNEEIEDRFVQPGQPGIRLARAGPLRALVAHDCRSVYFAHIILDSRCGRNYVHNTHNGLGQ